MSLDEDARKQLRASFREELAERLAAINAGLLSMEEDLAPAQRSTLLEELFRHVHSLKGAARAVEIKPIEELAHGLEDVFGAAKRGTIQLSPALFDLLYQGLDLVGTIMASLETGHGVDPALDLPGYLVHLARAWRAQPIVPPRIELATPPSSLPPATSPLPPEAQVEPGGREGAAGRRPGAARPGEEARAGPQLWSGESIRVPTARLDELMAQTGELLVTRLRLLQQLDEIKGLQGLLARWQSEWQRVRATIGPSVQQAGSGPGNVLQTLLEHNQDYMRSLSEQLARYARRVTDDTARLSLVTDQLQEGVKRARMLPLGTLVANFRRMVRDIAREKGVEAVLAIQGADTEMDKHVLEQIKDPLMHLLRNCIDHGIERPEVRQGRGKPSQGTITLSAERRGHVIVVEVSDDGAGIDTAAVREVAIRRGFLDAEAAAEMDEVEINALVFLPGLSTARVVTEVSGRGVGLDVVRRNVEALQGRVEVSSRRGQGVTFALTLPFTLASARCLLVRAAGRLFAVPIAAVERLVAVGPGDLARVEGQEAIRYLGKPLALVRLADVLHLPDGRGPLSARLPALILTAAGQRLAFLVDDLLSEEEIVVKNLGKQLARVPNIAGATILGTGQVVLILNVLDLVKSAQQIVGQGSAPVEEELAGQQERKSILIVDDSITTRTLEKNILTTAGYEVRLATDGLEALAALREDTCDLVVADIDMPRLDGFDLTLQLKADERYREIPVILVTSLDRPEDKARGIEVGADAYIIKSSFDQDVLLDTIHQLV
jgi:two-component system chemotaxis sensor kinase CheA